MLDGDLAPPKGAEPPPIFGLCLLWPDGWPLDGSFKQLWFKMPLRTEVRLCPDHVVLASHRNGHKSSPTFGSCLLWAVAKRSPISATAEFLYKRSSKNYRIPVAQFKPGSRHPWLCYIIYSRFVSAPLFEFQK